MARKPMPPPQTAKLTVAEMKTGIRRLEKRIADLEAFDVNSINERFDPRITALEASIDETLVAVFGPDTLDLNRYRSATNLDTAPMSMTGTVSLGRVRQGLEHGVGSAKALLQQAIDSLKERMELAGEEPGEREFRGEIVATETPAPNRNVFVVHGHDEELKAIVARLLSQLNLEPIILHEKPSMGRTIIEKFEQNSDVGFAVVLMSPDDVAAPKGTPSALQPRARQNVILELGYFFGKLGRARVCALKRGTMEIPSDYLGIVYVDVDPGDAWKFKLAKEIKAAGIDIDMNKVIA